MVEIDPPLVAKACNHCAKAKAKCGWETAQARCYRCTRLNKECEPQNSIRKRKVQKIGRAAQIVQLEEKVNNLLSAVDNGQRRPIQQPSPPSTIPSIPSPPSGSTPTVLNDYGPTSGQNPIALCQQFVTKLAPLGSSNTLTDDPGLNSSGMLVKDPNAMLSIFQDRLAPQMPFVVIPSGVGAEDLRKERPFVYMAVMMAASYEDSGVQIAISRKILSYLADRMLVRGEKTMDLLQGLLISLSWVHIFLQCNHQLNNLLGLASALFADLGLKLQPEQCSINETFLQVTKKVQGYSLQPKQLTSGEKRAIIGCYYLSSCLATTFSRMDSLRFTPFIDDLHESLAKRAEYKNDTLISQLMKLQSLVEKQRHSGLWESLCSQQPTLGRAPALTMVRSFQIELLDFKNSLTRNELFDPLFALHYYSAEIHLYEACFKMPATVTVGYSMDSLRHIDIVYCCFESLKSFFGHFLSIPSSQYFMLNIVDVGQAFHALGALYKLSVLNIAEWDVIKARQVLNLSDVLRQFFESLEEAGRLFGASEVDNVWFVSGRKLRLLMTFWDAAVAKDIQLNPAQHCVFDTFQPVLFQEADFLDESFWKL